MAIPDNQAFLKALLYTGTGNILNMNDVLLTCSSFELEGGRGKGRLSDRQLASILSKHYQSIAMLELTKAVSSISLLGNPLGLVRSVGGGITGIVTEPLAEAADPDSALGDIGLGLARGTLGLVRGVVGGAGNSISGLTSGVSDAVSILSLDQDYSHRRHNRLRREKPQNLVEGLYRGGKTVLGGLTEAVSGPVLQPWEGAKRSGMGGFFGGIVKGIVGVPVKAVGGVLDGVSQLTDGFASTFESTEGPAGPIRHPYLFSKNPLASCAKPSSPHAKSKPATIN